MGTRLYLRNSASGATGRPTDSEAIVHVDRGSVGAARFTCLVASRGKGGPCGGQYEEAWIETAVSGPPWLDFESYLRTWLSGRRFAADQALSAGSHFAIGAAFRANLPTNPGYGELRFFIYLWRPGVGYVATLSHGYAGERMLTTTATRNDDALETWFLVECPALYDDVQALKGDRIACEVWAHFHVDEAGASGTGTYRAYWDGADDSKADGETLTSAAAYVEYSDTLQLEDEMEYTNILVGARDIEVDGVNVGALDGGVEYAYNATLVEHEVDQRLGIVGADKIKERVTVKCRMKEATLESVRIAMAQPSWALSDTADIDTLNFGGERNLPTHYVSITGKAPGATDRTRTLYLRKVAVIDSGSHSYTKDGAVVIEVTFLCLETDTAEAPFAEGFRYGYFKDANGVFAFA